MDIRKQLQPLLLTMPESALHRALRTPTLFCGTSLARQAFIGMKNANSVSTRYLSAIRMRGHRDQITEIRFLFFADNRPLTTAAAAAGFLLTASKDTFVKLWDLS